jgi:hypothetical protein
MHRVFFIVLLLSLAASGADLSANLRTAAITGDEDEVKALLDKGANVEGKDKNGRTALMLAAQRGHDEIVKLLLAKGAHADARDRQGWTAYGLALLEPVGRGDHADVLKEFPAPPKLRLAVHAAWTPAQLQSSCFLQRGDLPAAVGNLHLNTMVLEEFLAFAGASGKGLAEIVRAPDEPSDALVNITVEPGAACVGGSDNLTLGIDVRVFRSSDHELLLEKSFGGGFKGLRAQTVSNAAQYAPVFQSWIRPQAGPMYWAVVEILYRSKMYRQAE